MEIIKSNGSKTKECKVKLSWIRCTKQKKRTDEEIRQVRAGEVDKVRQVRATGGELKCKGNKRTMTNQLGNE